MYSCRCTLVLVLLLVLDPIYAVVGNPLFKIGQVVKSTHDAKGIQTGKVVSVSQGGARVEFSSGKTVDIPFDKLLDDVAEKPFHNGDSVIYRPDRTKDINKEEEQEIRPGKILALYDTSAGTLFSSIQHLWMIFYLGVEFENGEVKKIPFSQLESADSAEAGTDSADGSFVGNGGDEGIQDNQLLTGQANFLISFGADQTEAYYATILVICMKAVI